MKAKQRFKWDKRTGAVLLILMLLLIAVEGIYYHETARNLNMQIQKELENENDGAKENISSHITTKVEWLKMASGIASLYDAETSNNQEEWWSLIEQFDKEEGYRIGIADNQGNLYYGSREKMDISDKETYQKALEGNTVISPMRKKAFNGMDSILLAAPIMTPESDVMGVIEVEYTTIELGNYLNHTDLNGSGVNLVIDSEGNLIASYEGMENYETIYDMLNSRSIKSGYQIDTMKKDVKSGKAGYLKYSLDGDERILYYQPAGMEDWTVVSIASIHAYSDTLVYLKKLTVVFMITVIALIGGSFFILLRSLWKRKLELDRVKIDYLTGVLTRMEGEKMVEEYLKARPGLCYGCLFLDLDDFKHFNDTKGHDEGDRILQLAGEVIRSSLRSQDIAYRFGGDEFCIWLFGNGGRDEVELVANRIMRKSKEITADIHFSIGATIVNKNEIDYRCILKRADDVLYEAKRAGKANISIQ